MKLMTRDNRWALHQSSTPARGMSDSAMMAELGRNLRSVYTELLREPLPEHLACIVRKLDKREGYSH